MWECCRIDSTQTNKQLKNSFTIEILKIFWNGNYFLFPRFFFLLSIPQILLSNIRRMCNIYRDRDGEKLFDTEKKSLHWLLWAVRRNCLLIFENWIEESRASWPKSSSNRHLELALCGVTIDRSFFYYSAWDPNKYFILILALYMINEYNNYYCHDHDYQYISHRELVSHVVSRIFIHISLDIYLESLICMRANAAG